MPKTRHVNPSRAIGRTLRFWREERGLSLRTVAEHAGEYPEPVGFDYLSRLERGHLMPSVPKLATLAAVYGRPLSDLIDLYEIEELRKLVPRRAGYDLCRRLGIESLRKGETTKALACFLGALAAARREGADRQKLAIAHNNAGHALMRGGRYTTARRYLEEGLRCVESQGTRARLLDNLAIVHYQLDDLILADVLSCAACVLAEVEPALRPSMIATRSMIVFDLGRYDEAEPMIREVLGAYESAGDETESIRQLCNLGHCLVKQGRGDEGLARLREAVVRAERKGDPHLRATSLFCVGRGLCLLGRGREAVEPLKAALEIALRECNRNAAFHSAFYLLSLAREMGSEAGQQEYETIARLQRVRLEQRSEEARAFDLRLAERRGKEGSPSHVH